MPATGVRVPLGVVEDPLGVALRVVVSLSCVRAGRRANGQRCWLGCVTNERNFYRCALAAYALGPARMSIRELLRNCPSRTARLRRLNGRRDGRSSPGLREPEQAEVIFRCPECGTLEPIRGSTHFSPAIQGVSFTGSVFPGPARRNKARPRQGVLPLSLEICHLHSSPVAFSAPQVRPLT